MQNLWTELRRRKVIRVAIAYLVGAWVLLQVSDTVLGLGDLPQWIGQAVLVIAILGLPVALVLSWMFDIRPEGIVTRDSGDSAPGADFTFSDPQPVDVGTLRPNRPAAMPLVARTSERAVITGLLGDAAAGKGSILLISGEPGIGKTRLGEEAIMQAPEHGMLGLVGHAYEERSTPFITSAEILEEIVRVLPRDALRNALGSAAPEIARLLPELRQIFPGLPQPADLPPEQQQRFLFKAVLEFLTRLSQSAPLVLLLDDLHWADESSILLLEHIAPRITGLPILMVITYRDVEADMDEPFQRVLARLTRQAGVTRMPIGRFSQDDVAALLKSLGASAPPAAVVEAIYRETNGNAFFVQSVYRHLTEEGQLIDSSGNWRPDIKVNELTVPDSVRLVTRRRLAKLSQQTQDLLAVAAVMGLRFRLSILEAAAADPESVLDAVEEAESAQLIKSSGGGRELRYEFVHALARHTLLDSLSAPRLQKLHLKIAEAIEAAGKGAANRYAANLAYHLNEAGSAAEAPKLVHWASLAGDNAMAAAAFEEAGHYFTLAIEAMGEWQEEGVADLLHARGAARLSQGRREDFCADLSEAFARYEKLREGEKAARVAVDLSYIYTWDAQPEKAFGLVTRGLALLGDEDTPGRCQLLSAQGLAHTIGRQPGEAERSHDAAVDLARRLADPGLLVDVLQNQAISYWMRLAGKAQHEPAFEAAVYRREKHQEWNLGHCLWMEKAGLVFQGRFDEAELIDDELEPIALRHEDFGSLACSALMSSTIAQARGDLEGCSREQRRSIEYFEAARFPWGVFSYGHLSANELLRGHYEEARRAFDLAESGRIPGIAWSGCETCYWLSGKAALGDTDVLEAYRSVQADLPQAGTAMASGAVMLLEGSIEALVLAGHDEEAAKLYPAIRDFVNSGLGVVAFTYGLHERFAGMAAAAAHDWEASEQHFRSALALAQSLPHRVDQARVRYWYARMLLARDGPGDRSQAREMLERARGLSLEMGMHGLVKSIDRLGHP